MQTPARYIFGSPLMVVMLVLLSVCCRAQEIKWPIHYRTWTDQLAPVKKGYIILNNNNKDTLRGYVKLLPYTLFYPILDAGTKKVRDVYIEDIESMRLFGSSLADRQFDEYFNLHYRGDMPWRLDGERKNVAIYDDAIKSGAVHRIILVKNSGIMKLRSGVSFLLHEKEIEDVLLGVINKRYHKHFEQENFNSAREMINYILDHESRDQ
jgi:hypothetical protein